MQQPGQGTSLIHYYFPQLTSLQIQQYEMLYDLYLYWNNRINVISRKDTENFYERHVLHSLGIAAVIQFKNNTHILDVGTGGGFPGIPLAIFFPDADFILVDSIGKKIKVVNEVIQALQLKNVKAFHLRAEEVKDNFDFVISRAVTTMKNFLPWVKHKINHRSFNQLANGILYLKGGDLTDELKDIKLAYDIYELKNYFTQDFFETKKLVHIKI
jgi:16S rRNA (guanine527-N7)-methyltransferase